jgi:hypothetical protein
MKIKTRKAAVVSRFHPSVAAGLSQEMKEKIILNDVMAMASGNGSRFESLRNDPTLRAELKKAVGQAHSYFQHPDSPESSEEVSGESSGESSGVDVAGESVVSENDPTVIIQGTD